MSLKIGSALVEVLFAAGIAAVGLLALVQVSTRSVSNSSAAKERSEATAVASEAMECVKNNKATLPWRTFISNVGSGCTCGRAIYSCNITSSGVRTVTPAAGATRTAQTVNVTVLVTWGNDTVIQTSDFYLY